MCVISSYSECSLPDIAPVCKSKDGIIKGGSPHPDLYNNVIVNKDVTFKIKSEDYITTISDSGVSEYDGDSDHQVLHSMNTKPV